MAVVAQNYPPPELNHRYQSQSIGASPQKAPGSRQSFDVSQLAGLGSSKTLSQDDTQRPMSFTAAANMNSFSQPAGAGQNPFPNPNNSLSHLSNAASRASIYTVSGMIIQSHTSTLLDKAPQC